MTQVLSEYKETKVGRVLKETRGAPAQLVCKELKGILAIKGTKVGKVDKAHRAIREIKELVLKERKVLPGFKEIKVGKGIKAT